MLQNYALHNSQPEAGPFPARSKSMVGTAFENQQVEFRARYQKLQKSNTPRRVEARAEGDSLFSIYICERAHGVVDQVHEDPTQLFSIQHCGG